MKFLILFNLLFISFQSIAVVNPWGVGLMIGSPTGVSGEYKVSQTVSYDAALAYDLGDHKDFHFHVNYLRHKKNIYYLDYRPFSIYYGVGLKLKFLEDRGPDEDYEFRIGPRIPVGTYYELPKMPLTVFLETAVTVTLYEKTTALLDVGLGARLYF
jgi:hypothetical protein